ncbi:MAG: hypothetical protein L0Y55_00015, partial [Anaerolineales bacterium]|nr:hypothetical protein [Anaerolineales bacterium]
SLLETFDDIYILDLHGSSKKKEKCPDGSKDENVFDIQQGVAIALFVRRGVRPNAPTNACVHHAELWGARETKYAALADSDVATTRWTEIEPKPEQFFFVPKDFMTDSEYQKGWSVEDIFGCAISGVQTKKDALFVDFDKNDLEERISFLLNHRVGDEQKAERLGFGVSDSWILEKARKTNLDSGMITPYILAPFDSRFVYYEPRLLGRARYSIMQHMLRRNLGLVYARQSTSDDYDQIFAVNTLVTDRCLYSAHGAPFLSPLYLYDAPDAHQTAMNLGARRVNLAPAFIAEMEARLGLKFAQTCEVSKTSQVFTPEDIFHYIYAVLHAPTYRQRYAEFLKIDFPRVPLTRDVKLFCALAASGAEL